MTKREQKKVCTWKPSEGYVSWSEHPKKFFRPTCKEADLDNNDLDTIGTACKRFTRCPCCGNSIHIKYIRS